MLEGFPEKNLDEISGGFSIGISEEDSIKFYSKADFLKFLTYNLKKFFRTFLGIIFFYLLRALGDAHHADIVRTHYACLGHNEPNTQLGYLEIPYPSDIFPESFRFFFKIFCATNPGFHMIPARIM